MAKTSSRLAFIECAEIGREKHTHTHTHTNTYTHTHTQIHVALESRALGRALGVVHRALHPLQSGAPAPPNTHSIMCVLEKGCDEDVTKRPGTNLDMILEIDAQIRSRALERALRVVHRALHPFRPGTPALSSKYLKFIDSVRGNLLHRTIFVSHV